MTDVYPFEKILCTVARWLFNPFILPAYIFIAAVWTNPFCKLYFLLYPKLFFIILVMDILAVSLIPLIYIQYSKRQKIDLNEREILILYLIINLINILLFNKIFSSAVFIPLKTSLIISALTAATAIAVSFVTDINLHCTTVGLILMIAFKMFTNSFVAISIALLLTGIVFSLYLVNGKTNIKQEAAGLVTGFCSVELYSLFV
ncbi:MAG: hypothetical protein IJ250_01610 [Bacteroidales bacterium]|nr:hypothetical protein [Bacteroidales bacterium]